MVFDNVANLIAQTITVNDAGDSIPVETSRIVYVSIKSIGMKRKLEAEQVGLKLEQKFILSDSSEYKNEEIIEFNGKRLNIVGVYYGDNNTVELTTARF